MKNRLLFFLVSALLTACGPDYIYEKQYPLEEEGWAYADTLDFTFSIDDTLTLYNLYLEVTHTTDYAYQNLYTRIYTRFPSGERKGQTVSLELADRTGAWQGDCRGQTCRFLAPIQMNAFFNEPGAYVFTLEQYMRESPVAGLQTVGFKLEETGESRWN